MSQYTSYWLYQKYEKRGDQDWIPAYPNVYSVDGEGSLTAVTKMDNDPACGYVPTGETIYRWVNLNPNVDYYCEECPPDPGTRIYRWAKTTNTTCVEDEPTPIEPQYRTLTTATTCVGYDLHVLEEHQVSNDGGVTWTTTGTTTGSLIEAYSRDCGYTPTPTGGTKWVATFTGGTTTSEACDASSAITSGEVSSDVASIEIGDCVTSIDERAFVNYTRLTSVTIPDSVTTIDNLAFQRCSSLTSVTIPNSVTYIGNTAFFYCYRLASVTIGNSVTYIDNGAFDSCTGLTSITVEASTPPSLGSNVFYGTNDCPIYVPCSAVSAYKSASGWSNYASRIHGIPPCEEPPKWVATFTGGTTSSAECDSSSAITRYEVRSDVASIQIGDCVTSVGYGAFSGCSSLTSVNIPSSVTTIGSYAFQRCTSLTGITIPDSVTSIGFNAFYNCTSLTSVTIPSSVTSIDSYAFRNCSGLSSVTVEATTPPALESWAFDGTNDCPIYVPSASVQAYKSASGWSDYASRIQAIT